MRGDNATPTRQPQPVIRTPDQRLRVFVSSTLQELAEERAAARQAIEALKLTPVLFELGARPHPARNLYRAYLEQSQIFLGIYWQRYGWIAPGESISGLEDEYRLAHDKPKLIYFKLPATREERLQALVSAMQQDERIDYRTFTTASELRELVTEDLAQLLTARFEQSRFRAAPAVAMPLGTVLPGTATPIVGRESELASLRELLLRDDVRLVVLVGPGGIGKSRLALELANRIAPRFRDGVAFVPLAAISDPDLVAPTIAQALGVRESVGEGVLAGLKAALRNRRLLLLLDNFEQVAAAAPLVGELLSATHSLKVLATSRAVLRLSGEHAVPVPPLSVPDRLDLPLETLNRSQAVRLFLERARAVRPDFAVTEPNLRAVTEICRKLDGLPLAIELAAARIRLLSPRDLLARLSDRLEVLAGGPRDLPARQQTLRSTIDWSYHLLDEDERRLFTLLGIFVGGASLEAIEAVCEHELDDPLGRLASLVDKSLVQQREEAGEVRFSMLETVRAYALEKLEANKASDRLAVRHAAYYLALAERAGPEMITHAQRSWLERFELDHDNLRAAFECSFHQGDPSTAARLGWALWVYWWIRGHQNEGLAWMNRVLEASDHLSLQEHARACFVAGAMAFIQGDFPQARRHAERCLALAREVGDRQAKALGFLGLGLVAFLLQDFATARTHLEGSLANFRRDGDGWGMAHALHYLWRLAAAQGDGATELAKLRESAALFREVGDTSALVLALRDLAMTDLAAGALEHASARLEEGLELSLELKNHWYVAYCLEGLAGVSALQGHLSKSAQLFGAAEALRERINAPLTPADHGLYAPLLAVLEAGLEPEERAQLWHEGRLLGLDAGVADAHAVLTARHQATATLDEVARAKELRSAQSPPTRSRPAPSSLRSGR